VDLNVYSFNSVSDKEFLDLISQRESFVLEGIQRTNMGEAVRKVEMLIESRGLKCRVYLKGRSATVAAVAMPVSPLAIGGWLSGIAIGIHNIATWNPDYEIAKNLATGTLTLSYKKID
jgi:hypothetical protein